MKKLLPSIMLSLLSVITAKAQTTLVNYDFNSASSYPVSPSANASGISCSVSSSESFQTYTGIATSTVAFVQNITAGNALAMANSGGNNTRYFMFQLSGSSLGNYQGYKIYMQPQRSTTGATLVTVAYSTDGNSFTNTSTTYPVGISFSDVVIDLSGITAINNVSSLYIKMMVSGASATTGTIRIDNVQFRATQGTSGGGNPWQTNGNNVNFTGNVGIGTPNPQYPLDVAGSANIGTNLSIGGNATVTGDLSANRILFGTAANSISMTSAVMANGARVIANGSTGPLPQPPTTCMPPFLTGDLQQSHRFTVTKASSNNMLDLTNDGTNGAIDYGFDINQYLIFDPNNPAPQVRPALKLNGFCWGDVEIAKGGGFVSAGNYFEVGNPTRSGAITSNINGGFGRIGQRVTTSSTYPESFPNPPDAFNTQLYVNRSKIKALTVFNTSTNAGGDQTFVVYGSGKTHIGLGRPLSTGIAANAMLTVDGLILAKEVRVAISTNTHWADYVFDKNYKLMSLKDVEAYVKTNKHLPEVPSSQEVQDNGIEVTEISATLLKKIEELTLYTIELKKQLDAQQIEIKKLKK